MDEIQPQSSRDPQHKKEDNVLKPSQKPEARKQDAAGKKRFVRIRKRAQAPKAGGIARHLDVDNREVTADQGKIFRVHQGLRKSNPDAYEPMLISIGPYHWDNKSLMALQGHKERYSRTLFARLSADFVKSCKVMNLSEEWMNRLEKAAKSYASPIMLDSRDDFWEMLLLDGSFIVEFVRECWESQQEEAAASPGRTTDKGPKARNDCFIVEFVRECCQSQRDEAAASSDDRRRGERPKARNGPTFSFNWMYAQATRDLLLFENQLPYSFPEALYEISHRNPTTEPSFNDMVKHALKSSLPDELFPSQKPDYDLPNNIKHLLHAAHILCCPPSHSDGKDHPERKIDRGRDQELLYQMHSATELQEAGVSFEKGNRSKGIFGIKFDKGVMAIPSLTIVASTESLFRNLIAYEQYSPGLYPKYFSDYATFMDRLINSSKDVTILRLEGILVNLLGDDGMVAKMFNNLADGIVMSSRFYYSDVFKKVNDHCKKPWSTKMAMLRRDYFNSPWAGISTVAAVVLLVLTLAQTIGTFTM